MASSPPTPAIPAADPTRLRRLNVVVGLVHALQAVVLLAILWITRSTIIHHTGVDLFPFLKK